MKKLFFSLASCLVLTACQVHHTAPSSDNISSSSSAITQTSSSPEMTYADYTAILTPITPEVLQEKMATGEAFILFLGRETCPYCQAFVPKLHEALTTTPRPVYYYNTADKTDADLQLFRDTYGIKTIPNLSYYEGNQLVSTLPNGSESSVTDIITLLEQLQN